MSRRFEFLNVHFGRRRSRSVSTSRTPREDHNDGQAQNTDPAQEPGRYHFITQVESPTSPPPIRPIVVTDNKPRDAIEPDSPSKLVTRIASHASLGSSSRDTAPPKAFPGKLDLTIVYEPHSRNLDIIFVHGLGGGSRRTWCYNKNPSIFWPEWLSQIPTLSRARVSTFGYNADIIANTGTTQTSVESFAKQLLHSLTIHGQRDEKFGRVPIIFICHSMGGLVVKRACVKADRDPSLRSLSANISGVIFLGTPHRGSSQAKKLNSLLFVLGLGSADKVYLKDITVNSGLLQMLNDDFRHLAMRIRLFSFWEQKKTPIGSFELMVVEQYSAILGYSEEGSAPLFANHHLICKFSSPADPNYITVTSTLISMVDKILENVQATTPGDQKRHVEEIYKFLLTPDLTSTEADFYAVQSKRMEGSCHWLMKQPWFINWQRDGLQSSSEILWLTGHPGTGKSVMSTFIVDQIRQTGRSCYYYFFKGSDISKRSLERCLLSIAYQISLEDRAVRDTLRKLHDSQFRLLGTELLLLWQKIFISRILPIYEHNNTPLFLVIDALDEAENSMELFPLLNTLRSIPSLRLCVASRSSVEFTQQFNLLANKIKVTTYNITPNDNLTDITSLITITLSNLPLLEEVRLHIVKSVIEKSEGNFLWVALVSKQMLKAGFNQDSLMQILGQVPPGMNRVYADILEKMKAFPPKQMEIAKWIIQWTLSSFQPLRVSELQEALQFKPPAEKVEALEYWIAELCGSFLVVDREKSVQPMHNTVREFLLADTSSDYAITSSTHVHITKSCIETILKTNSFIQARKLSKAGSSDPDQLLGMNSYTLWSYAVFWWSDHLGLANGRDPEIFQLVTLLLKSHKFVECIRELADSGDLFPLIRMARNLKRYTEILDISKMNGSKEDIKLISLWTVDLIRLTTEFGENLLKFPSLVETVVAPFCPRSSAMYRCFGSREGGILLVGDVPSNWETRLACLTTTKAIPSAGTTVAATSKVVAVGYQDGLISIWNSTTCLLIHELDLTEPVLCMSFNHAGSCIAAGGRKIIKIWNPSTALEMLSLSVEGDPVLVSFSPDDSLLFGIFRNNQLNVYSVDDGALVTEFDWAEQKSSTHVAEFPLAVSLNSQRTRMAVAYRGLPVSLWDIEEKTYLKKFRLACPTPSHRRVHDQGQRGFATYTHDSVAAMEFSSITNEIFISYSDGTFVKWDPDANEQITASIHADIHVMKCSPDGTIIVTGNSGGVIRVWSSSTLELLYTLEEDDEAVRRLCFSSDGRRIFDVRGVYCNVWAPEILLRGAKIYRETRTPSPVEPHREQSSSLVLTSAGSVTCLCPSPSGKYFLAGTSNGQVILYSLSSGKKLKILYHHASSAEITTITWSTDCQIIATGDSTSKVFAYRLSITDHNDRSVGLQTRSFLFNDESESDYDGPTLEQVESNLVIQTAEILRGFVKLAGRFDGAITSLLIDKNKNMLLASTRNAISVWKLKNITRSIKKTLKPVPSCLIISYGLDRSILLLQHPHDNDMIMIVDSEHIRVQTWSFIHRRIATIDQDSSVTYDASKDTKIALGLLVSAERASAPGAEQVELQEAYLAPTRNGLFFVTCISKPRQELGGKQKEIWVFRLEDIAGEQGKSYPVVCFGTAMSNTRIQSLLGVVGGKLYFLDLRGWLCSKDFEEYSKRSFSENNELQFFDMWFFLPRGQVTPEMSSTISCTLIWKKDVIFTRREKVIVVKRGLRGQGRSVTA